VEIPVRGGNDESVHVMQLRIEQEREGDGGDVAPLWTVTLNFELEKLGPIRAGITLIGQRHVSVGLWAESEETVALFDEHLSTLHERMAEAGLTVGHLGVRRGERPAEPDEHARNVPGPLVDEQA
jgi:hypothetical protein